MFFNERKERVSDSSFLVSRLNSARLRGRENSELMILGVKQQEELAQLQTNLFYPPPPAPQKGPDGVLYHPRPSKLQIQYRRVQSSDSPLFRVKQLYDKASPAAVFEVLKNYKQYNQWFPKCTQSDDSTLYSQPLGKNEKAPQPAQQGKNPIISQVFKHNSLEFPFNEKELIFQAFSQKQDDTYFIALKSDTRLLQSAGFSKNAQGLGGIVTAAQSKFSHQNKFNKVFFKEAERIWNQEAS